MDEIRRAVARAVAAGWVWPDSVVTRIVDGDSFDALVTRRSAEVVDIGFGGKTATKLETSFTVRLRLNRINTPPAKTAEGRAATALASQLMLAAPVHIVTVGAYKFGGPDTSPGEWMAEVTLPDGGNVSDVLVDTGVAVYWNGAGPRPGG